MALRKKPRAKAKARKSTAASGLKKFQATVKKATKAIDARIKKAESAIAKLKREKAAKRKKAIAGYKRKTR